MKTKTFARRIAALLVTAGLALGVGVMTPANASDDTGWGRITNGDTIHD